MLDPWRGGFHYDHDHESNTVSKNPPPGVNQLRQHMFCQFGVAYCLPFHRFFAELGRVLGGVGLSGIVGTSGNGMAAEASAYPLLKGTRTRTSMGK